MHSKQAPPIATSIGIISCGALLATLHAWRDAREYLVSLADRVLGGVHPEASWYVHKTLENVGENFSAMVLAPISLGEQLHWINIAGFVAFALIAVWLYERDTARRGIRALIRHIFPPEYYGHASAHLDYQLFLFNRIFRPVRLVTRLLSDAAVAGVVVVALTELLGPAAGIDVPRMWAIAAYTLGVALLSDFLGYLTHMAMHRIPFLWEFHKLHHSAEVLTPITAYRVHPVERIIGDCVSVVVLGALSGVLAYTLLERPSVYTILGAGAVVAVFHAAGHHVRHSHLWLSWGPVLNRVFISPAQHQIHHSTDPKHFEKNYGFIFALWDWMFGTLYVPKSRENLTFGLRSPQVHPTLTAAYLRPFRDAWHVLWRPNAQATHGAAAAYGKQEDQRTTAVRRSWEGART